MYNGFLARSENLIDFLGRIVTEVMLFQPPSSINFAQWLVRQLDCEPYFVVRSIGLYAITIRIDQGCREAWRKLEGRLKVEFRAQRAAVRIGKVVIPSAQRHAADRVDVDVLGGAKLAVSVDDYCSLPCLQPL